MTMETPIEVLRAIERVDEARYELSSYLSDMKRDQVDPDQYVINVLQVGKHIAFEQFWSVFYERHSTLTTA